MCASHTLGDDEAVRWLSPGCPPVLSPQPHPNQQCLLSCFDWQVLRAPWVFVFTCFGLLVLFFFFLLTVGLIFVLTTRYTWLAATQAGIAASLRSSAASSPWFI